MADQTSSGGNTFLAFVLGGVVIVLGIVAFFALGGDFDATKQVDVKIEAPDVKAPKPGDRQ